MFRHKFKISFDVHKFCFCDDDGGDDNYGEGDIDDDDDDGDNIAIVYGMKTMVFQTWDASSGY